MREHLRQAYEPGRKGVAGVHLLGGPLWEARVVAEIRYAALKVIHREHEGVQLGPAKETHREGTLSGFVRIGLVDEAAEILLYRIREIVIDVALVGIEYQTVQLREVLAAEYGREFREVL